jgi:hypothetical protein
MGLNDLAVPTVQIVQAVSVGCFVPTVQAVQNVQDVPMIRAPHFDYQPGTIGTFETTGTVSLHSFNPKSFD